MWKHLTKVLPHVGLFLCLHVLKKCESIHSSSATIPQPLETTTMEKPTLTMAQQIAQAASAFEHQRTGITPGTVTVVLSEDTLVITMHGTLSPAERALAQTAEGAARVQEFHRQLFTTSAEPLRQEIKRITGVEVREATAEVETATGTVVQVFTTGAMVQVFLLAHPIATETWSGNGHGTNS